MASLLEKHGYYEWLCHSNYSFLYGASHPEEFLRRACELGYQGLALTDYDGVYGLARAYRHQRDGKIPIKLFYGCEFHLQKDAEKSVLEQDTLAVIARNHSGYRLICELSSQAHVEGKHDPSLSLELMLQRQTSDLVYIQPMRGVWHYQDDQVILERLNLLKDTLGEQLYCAVHRTWNPGEDRLIAKVHEICKKLGIPILLTQDPYFHTPERKLLCDIQFAIRKNQPVYELQHHLFSNRERSLQSLEKIHQKFFGTEFYEQALIHSAELAQEINFSFAELRYQYPEEMIPKGMTALAWLRRLVELEAGKRYPEGTPNKVQKILNKELELVEKLQFADYFLTVWDIVRWARSKKILCQGRGSAANSAICYVLGVTSVDPSTFDVLFERFISVERGDPPDIDVDFEHERREEVIQYIYSRYGRHRAAMVANVIRFKRKGSMRFVGKALGIDENTLSEISKIVGHRRHHPREQANRSFDKATNSLPTAETLPETITNMRGEEVSWDAWKKLADSLMGFPRHLGIHSGGFMIASHHLNDLVGLEPATMPGRSVIQWDKEDIEALNFFKIDVLALGMLSAVRGTLDLIHRYYGKSIEMVDVPGEDPVTYGMIQRADTVGTFQIESRAQMSMLPRLKPRTFYDLVIQVAIIRPGPIQGGLINPYLRRRWGKDAIIYPHPLLEPILERTLGVPIFQEQVMRIAMAVGGFSGGEADALRRHMGSWQIKGDLGPMLKQLAKGMAQFGIKKHFIEQILDQMQAFAHYGFPESHSTSFALIAYVSSWLKCHYPNAFFAALLNAQPMGFYSPHSLLQQAKRDGVCILPVCVKNSEYFTCLEAVEDDVQKPTTPSKVVSLSRQKRCSDAFVPAARAFNRSQKKFAIRLGLHMVRDLREEGAKAFVVERKKNQWLNIDAYLTSQNLIRSDWMALAKANAFNAFHISRREMIWKISGHAFHTVMDDIEPTIQWNAESSQEQMASDFKSFQTSLTAHPVEIMKKEGWNYQVDQQKLLRPGDQLHLHHGRWVQVFGLVIVRQMPPTAKGFVFITLEDEEGSFNLVFKPDFYKRWATMIESEAFLCVGGILQRQIDACSIMVREVYPPLPEQAEVVEMEDEANKRRERAMQLDFNSRDFH